MRVMISDSAGDNSMGGCQWGGRINTTSLHAIQLNQLMEVSNSHFSHFVNLDYLTDALESHEIGKRKTQRIERKHLNLRTRIKRLTKQDYLLIQDGRDARFGNWFVH